MIGADPVAEAVALHKSALTELQSALYAYHHASALDLPSALGNVLDAQVKVHAYAHLGMNTLATEQRSATLRAMGGGILAALLIRVVQGRR